MARKNGPFITGEWYHCHNHSIEKRISFADPQDYHRFLELLYLANDESPLRRDDINVSFKEVMGIPRGKRLVAIGAFCLMPDRFDLVVKEISEGGITAFMRKLGTAYTLYFNVRHGRAGNLFLKPFRSSHVPADHPFQRVISYVHTNPAALYEPEWKKNHIVDPQFLQERLMAYPYSSLGAHSGVPAPTRAILDLPRLPEMPPVSLKKMLQEARQYSIDAGIS